MPLVTAGKCPGRQVASNRELRGFAAARSARGSAATPDKRGGRAEQMSLAWMTACGPPASIFGPRSFPFRAARDARARRRSARAVVQC
jgi:hypothetical protein